MRLMIENYNSDYYVNSNLSGLDETGAEVNFIFSMENFIHWVQLPIVVVFDEFDNEVQLSTNEIKITGLTIL